ncbi:Uncharacterised protein [Klebsiella pneumoniae]|nr:Uncharacterised protein [Klebsiella pneumoniae]
MPDGGYALPGLLVRLRLSPGPASNCAAGRWHQARSCFYAGWRLRLIRPTRPAPTVSRPGKQRRRRAMASGTELLFMPGGGCALPGLQPQITAGAGAAETAGAGGLNIAETFPEGRGSPHGCWLRAVFCRDAASARPEACRDKSKAPRSGDVAGRSPGVQGAAATGRPLCAPGAMSDIAQKKYWERNLSGNNIEVVALPGAVCTGKFTLVPLFRRVAAAPYPAYRGLSHDHTS